MGSLTSNINLVSLFYAIICTAVLAFSCASNNTNTPIIKSVKDPINAVSSTTKSVSEGIVEDTRVIDVHVGLGKAATPKSLQPTLNPHWNGIQGASDDLKVLKGQLDGAQVQIQQALSNGDALEKQNATLVKDVQDRDKSISDLKADSARNFKKAMLYLTIIGVIGIAASVALMAAGNMKAIWGGIGSLVLIGTSILVGQYSMWVAIGAGVGILAAIGFVVYNLILKHKAAQVAVKETQKAEAATQVAVKETQKAVKISTQLAQTVEASKMAMLPDARRYIFGNGAIPGHTDVIQAPITRDFVRRLRSNKAIKLAPTVEPVTVTKFPGQTDEPTIILDESKTIIV